MREHPRAEQLCSWIRLGPQTGSKHGIGAVPVLHVTTVAFRAWDGAHLAFPRGPSA